MFVLFQGLTLKENLSSSPLSPGKASIQTNKPGVDGQSSPKICLQSYGKKLTCIPIWTLFVTWQTINSCYTPAFIIIWIVIDVSIGKRSKIDWPVDITFDLKSSFVYCSNHAKCLISITSFWLGKTQFQLTFRLLPSK